MKNTPKKFTAGEKVATPLGYCYVVSDVGDGYVVSTKKVAGSGVNREFPYDQVKPYLIRPFHHGEVVTAPGGPCYVIDVLHPKQVFSTSLYQSTRKQTGLPKPFKAIGEYTSCRTYSYLVWGPKNPLFVMWYGQWQLSSYTGDIQPLDTKFDEYFNLIQPEGTTCIDPVVSTETPIAEQELEEEEEEDDEPENLNDLNVPGLSQGVPIQ